MINNWLKMKRKKVQQRDQLIEQVVHNKSSVLLSSPSFHWLVSVLFFLSVFVVILKIKVTTRQSKDAFKKT